MHANIIDGACMRHVAGLLAAMTVAGCATTYTGPKVSVLMNDCYTMGANVRNLSSCVSRKLDAVSDRWREDGDYEAIMSLFTVTDALGSEVTDGRMSEGAARLKAEEYLSMLRQQKYLSHQQRLQQSAAFLNAGIGMMGVQQQIRANEISAYNANRPRTCTYQAVGSTLQQICN